jgi:hypothetical protein
MGSVTSFEPKTPGGADEPQPGDPPADRNGEVAFHGERCTNATHASTTDPDTRLYCKGRGREAKLCYLGHALMESPTGLLSTPA